MANIALLFYLNNTLLLKNFYDENLDFLTNAKVQKIQQPSRKELLFHLRNHQMKSYQVEIQTMI